MTSEIISLLEDLPVNVDMKASFYEAMLKIPKGPSDNLGQWSGLFAWNELGSSQKMVLPPMAFYNLMLLHEFILGYTKRVMPRPGQNSFEIPIPEKTVKFI